MTQHNEITKGDLIWSGRPSVSTFYEIYGALAAVLMVILVPAEFWLGDHTKIGGTIFPATIQFVTVVEYPVEIATVLIISAAYMVKVIRLAILKMRNRYQLYGDGLYIDTGLVNLQNAYITPMGFSDARLVRTWSLRLGSRGNLLVDTNDQRHFELKLLEKPALVQALIRKTLGHPTVRVDNSNV